MALKGLEKEPEFLQGGCRHYSKWKSVPISCSFRKEGVRVGGVCYPLLENLDKRDKVYDKRGDFDFDIVNFPVS